MKNVTLKVRVTEEQRAAWTKASIAAGAPDLSTFIRGTIDEEIKWVSVSFEDSKTFLESLAGVAESADALASNPSVERREGSSPSSGICPRKFTHVPGVYCTACGSTPT